MNKANKYRIYPTLEQAVLFAKTFGSYVSMRTINTKEKHEECRKRKVVSIFQDFLA